MAGNIKGITIEFQGDTTKLDKALRTIKNSTKDIDKELKAVDKALKFNPTSVELWRQKQDLLKKKITETESNLKSLKDMQKQMDVQGVDKQSEAYRTVSREIIEAESKLKTFNAELRKVGQVNLRAMSEQFKEMGNKLTSAGQAMRGLSTAAAAVVASIGALTVKSGAWADDINTMSKVYSIGTKELQLYAAAADLVDVSVETIAKSHVKLEKQMLTASKGTGASAEAFEALGVSVTNADGSLRDGDAVWQDTIVALGSLENETERDAYAMQLMGRSAAELNPLIEDGGETYKQVADTIAKYGLDFIDQDTLDKANEFNDSLDMIKAIGSTALQQLGTALAGYLAPAMEKVVDAAGKLAKWVSDLDPKIVAIVGSIAAVVAAAAPVLIGIGKISTGLGAVTGLVAKIAPMLGGLAGPIAIVVAGFAALYAGSEDFRNAVNDLVSSALETLIGVFEEIKPSIDTLLPAILSLVQTIGSALGPVIQAITPVISALVKALGEIIQVIAPVITWIAQLAGSSIGTLISAFQSIMPVVRSVASAISTAWNTVRRVTTTVWNAITKPIQTAVGIIRTAINTIRKIINGAKLELPKFKLPHFKISGGKLPWGIGGKGTKPTISVDWYAKGGIFDRASIIGVGEAGDEAALPLDPFWKKLDQWGETISNAVAGGSGGGTTTIILQVDGRELARVIAPHVEPEINKLQSRANRKLGYI